MYSIFVTIDVKPEHVEEFTQASFGDARGSVRDEPGCFRFDINQDREIPGRFYLYEVYRDEEAFQAHLEAPHFKEWIGIVKPMFARDLESVSMNTVFPSDSGWEQQKPGLVNW
ncbi:MAG: putative quinol monooxygenase [Gemmatimonadetes bacterium]|nr:putative quinol monooxygenase [Gemmatimonadota bacterium]